MVKAGYKQTEIGAIPEDWDVKTLQNAMEENFITDQMDGNHGELYPRSHEFVAFGVPYISANDFANGRVSFGSCKYLRPERAKKFKKGIAKDGDVLFAHNATVGPVAVLKCEDEFVILSTTATYYRCNENLLENYYLKSSFEAEYFKKQYTAVMSQSTRNQVPITAQRKFRVALPKRGEQKAIAEALSDVDGLIASLEALIEKKRQIKTGAMQQLLTGKVRLPGFGEGKGSKQTELGEIPEDWEIVNFSKLAEIDPENLGSNTDSNYAFNYISLEDASRGNLRGFSEQIFQSSPSRARRILKDRDVLFGTVRPNLKSHYLFENHNGNWICSTGFAVLRAKEKIADPGFIFYSLFSRAVEKQIDTLIAGSNYPAVNSRDVNQLIIAKPNFDEQQAISKIIKGFDVEVGALEQRLAKTKALKQGMMQELLTGRTRLI